MSEPNTLIFEILGFLFGLVILIRLWRNPNKFYFLAFIAAVVMTTIIELAGIRDHQSYYYADFLIEIPASPGLANLAGGAGRDFPLVIAVQWAVIVYCSTLMVDRLQIRWQLTPLICGLIATSLDMALDPVAASSLMVDKPGDSCVMSTTPGDAEGVGIWVWCIPQSIHNYFYFGVPLQNFYAWFLVIAIWTFFQRIAYNTSYNGTIDQQLNALIASTSISLTVFFTALNYFLNLGTSYAWPVLIGLFVLGLGALLSAGKNRLAYSFDWWAFSVVLATILFCIIEIFANLLGSASVLMLISAAIWCLVSVLLAAWVIVGKRLLGQPYP